MGIQTATFVMIASTPKIGAKPSQTGWRRFQVRRSVFPRDITPQDVKLLSFKIEIWLAPALTAATVLPPKKPMKSQLPPTMLRICS